MRKIIMIGAIVLSLTTNGAVASIHTGTAHAAASSLKLEVDGQTVLPAIPPFYSGELAYVPARVLLEYYPGDLKWNNTLKTLTFSTHDDMPDSTLKPGDSYMKSYFAQNQKLQLDGPAILRNGHMYIPVNTLTSLTGATVKLDTARTSVTVIPGSLSTTVRTPTEPLAVAEDNPKVKLYAVLKDGHTYKGHILEVNGKKHTYNWQTPRLLSHPPQLFYADIDKDGKPEVVVVMTLGTGTGMVEQRIHVVNPEDWTELAVPEAYKAAGDWLSSSVSAVGKDMLVKLQVKGDSASAVTLRFPDRMSYEGEDGTYNKHAGIGAVTYYSVESGKLKAVTNVTIGFVESIGNLTVLYQAGGSGMEAGSVKFELHDEYAQYVVKP
ncbi:copper amine oxidase N-terminal domain-containing protein [Paenibacillus donghaensis]|uniref:Copper amine oxidase-like N-terminal domain-containing protein n=1 Tax=Paenibacillus donghaensis TaxID=414771 RepID=A0A2Z2K9D8_9BACL|nr:copper amine oxidase N-terminal domain-containing protein [Paenibacillus donghaensis]ASA19440.1 hypothetical protein B9T62_00365 [Paenibacillus donghaensis]